MEHMGQFIMNHWGQWLVLVIVLMGIFINELLDRKKRATELSPQAAVALLNDDNAVVVDLRGQELFQKGHIIDAVCATADDFSGKKMDKYKSKTLLLVCARGQNSTQLAVKLREQGFQQIAVLAGGMAAWQSSDLPLVRGK